MATTLLRKIPGCIFSKLKITPHLRRKRILDWLHLSQAGPYCGRRSRNGIVFRQLQGTHDQTQDTPQ